MTDEEKEKFLQFSRVQTANCQSPVDYIRYNALDRKDKELGYPRISIIEEKDLDERKYEIMKKLEMEAREKPLEDRSERYNSLQN